MEISKPPFNSHDLPGPQKLAEHILGSVANAVVSEASGPFFISQ